MCIQDKYSKSEKACAYTIEQEVIPAQYNHCRFNIKIELLEIIQMRVAGKQRPKTMAKEHGTS
jgi:hypothetical protein